MTRHVGIFWGSALAATITFALLSAVLLPFEALQLETLPERQRGWLLTLWSTGVLAVLFGFSSLLGSLDWIGVRDVFEAGSVRNAVEVRRRARVASGCPPFHRSFGWWLVTVGILLIGFYFCAWVALE